MRYFISFSMIAIFYSISVWFSFFSHFKHFRDIILRLVAIFSSSIIRVCFSFASLFKHFRDIILLLVAIFSSSINACFSLIRIVKPFKDIILRLVYFLMMNKLPCRFLNILTMFYFDFARIVNVFFLIIKRILIKSLILKW